MPKYSVTIAQDTFLLREAKRLGTDEADALRILIEVAMTREPKQHCASPSSVSQIFYPVPTPYSDCSFAAWLVQQAGRDDGVGVAAQFFSKCPPEANSVKAHIDRIKSRLDTTSMLDGLLARPSQFATSTTVEKLARGSRMQFANGRLRAPSSPRRRLSGFPCKGGRFRYANLNLPSNMIPNCAFAMAHSRGGILHSFWARFNTRKRSFSALSSVGKWPRAQTALCNLACNDSIASYSSGKARRG